MARGFVGVPEFEKSAIYQALEPTGGVGQYITSDGVDVLMVHWSADHDIDTPEGRAWVQQQMKRGYRGGMRGQKWQTEMEMSHAGNPATRLWPDWLTVQQPAIAIDPIEIEDHWPIWLGYDYGGSNPFAFIPVAWADEYELYQFDEVYAPHTGLHDQVAMLQQRPWWPRVQGIIGDPSIWNKNQNIIRQDGSPQFLSIGEIMRDNYDMVVERGDNSPGVDIAFRNYLDSVLWRDLEEPKFKIFNTCTNTLREFRKLRLKQWKSKEVAADNNNYETIVNKENHAWDALKYLLLWRQEESPEMLGPPTESFEWYRQQLVQRARDESAILQ